MDYRIEVEPDTGWGNEISIRHYDPADEATLRALVLQLHESLRPLDADLAPG